MKPDINAYKILSLERTYFVLDPYDLFTMPCVKINSPGFESLQKAESHKQCMFESDLKQYERLKEQGRGFPDND